MVGALIFAALGVMVPQVAPGPALAVLHIKVVVTDAEHKPAPVARHALLISDNPATAPPRRVVTGLDGRVDVRLRPGSYTVESDQPVAAAEAGTGYQWTELVAITTGTEVVLDLTVANAEVVRLTATTSSATPTAATPPLVPSQWDDGGVEIWTRTSHTSGLVIDARGLIVASQGAIGDAATVEVQLTSTIKVEGRVLLANAARDVAIVWIDPQAASNVRPVPGACGPSPMPVVDNLVASIAAACEVLASAESAMRVSTPPPGTRLPVEPATPFPSAALKAAFERRGTNLTPYRMSSSDFDIAFITPLMVYAAEQPDRRTTSQDMRPPQMDQMRVPRWNDFGNWSEYVQTHPPVLLVRVTPKLAESFWTTLARGAAMTQGMSLPAIKRFTSALAGMRAFCGDAEVTPIHPLVLESRPVGRESVAEGLYVFDPASLGPHCGTVTLAMSSVKDPERTDRRTVDPAVLRQLWQDFEPYRTE